LRKKALGFIKNIQFTEKSVPWILLTAGILAFGIFIPKLGYFQDDWNFVFNYYTFGSKGLANFLSYDGRPYAVWIFDTGFRLLGFHPIYWHITELLLRCMTGYVLWLVFRFLWPNHKWQPLTASLIFILYPFFTLQPLAVTYTLHWTGYLLYSLSIYFMLRAQTNRFWSFTILALITQAAHLLTLEYYAGIELVRPIFLWIVVSSFGNLPNREKLKITLRRWMPYLVIFIIYFIWRGFIYQATAEGRNSIIPLDTILRHPLTAVTSFINTSLPDLVLILITSWYKLITPTNFDFSNSANRYTFLITIFSIIVFFFFLSKQKNSVGNNNNPSTKGMLFTGLIALILSLLPTYATGLVIHTKIEPWNSRFSLGSLLGASLIITSFISYAFKVPKTRWVIISTLLGLLVGWHLQSTNTFRWAWEKQVNFYRQLYLRAPSIQPGTILLSGEEFLLYMGDYPLAYGINTIYAKKGDSFNETRTADYWYFPLSEFYSSLNQHLNGEPFSTTRAGATFQGEPDGSIVISFEPENSQCLWVMRPEYASNKALSQNMRQLTSISFIERIERAPENPDSFLLKYLYTNPEQDWCYYYEKADLAYQYEDWDEILDFWKAARQSDLQPGNGFELLPFIEAYAHTNDWKTAERLTLSSPKTAQGIDPLLCNTWSKLENNTVSSPEKNNAVLLVTEELNCGQE